MGLLLTMFWGFSMFENAPAKGAAKSVTVCQTKSKVLVATTKKKTCNKGETRIVLSSRLSAQLCVNSKTRQITVSKTRSCSSGRVPVAQLATGGTLPICVNTTTRRLEIQRSGRCPKGSKTQRVPVPQSQDTATQNSTTVAPTTTIAPENISTTTTASTSTTVLPTTTSTPSNPTTTAPTTTTTVPPATIASFTVANTTINGGSSTTLSASFFGASATIDQSVGSITNGGSVTVSPAATTTYTITVSNGANHSISSFVTVQVNTLSVTSQPQSLTTNNVNGAAISVTAAASGAASYQWYKDSNAISGAITSSYLATQNGSYHVVITSVLNGVSRSLTSNTSTFAINTVSISSQPTSALIGDNETATFSVTALGSGTLSYQWTRSGVDISGATSSSYTTDVAGSYVVVVTSTLNGIVKNLNSEAGVLTINTVTITSSPSDSFVTQGDSQTLTVSVSSSGSATITYQWYLNNSTISGATSNSYVVTQAGTYKVRVTSTRSGTTAVRFSSEAVVTEVPAPAISGLTASPASIAVGNSTTITPVFSGGTAVMSPGDIALTSGVGVLVSPSTTTLYTVRVTNPAGNQATRTINVVVTSGTFSATANSGSANRWYGSRAVTLQNGKVLVFGSTNGSKATDLYDPATNSFRRVGDLNQGRRDPVAALLPNGKVIAIGGNSGTAYLATAEVFDPVTETWSYTGSLATAREHSLAVTLSDGRILVAGGITTGNVRLSSVEIYDPVIGQFTTAASMPQARQGPTGALMANGNVFVAGGYNTVDLQMKSAIIYNPGTDTWTTVSSQMNAARVNSSQSPGAVTVLLTDGRLLIGGGWSGGTGVSTLDLYDPATDSFVTSGLPQLPYGGSTTAHLMSNGLVAFFGGSGSGTVSNTAVLYDPISNTMTAEANTMSSMRYMHTSARLNDGRIIIIGGTNEASASAHVYTQ